MIKKTAKVSKDVLKGKVFGFVQVDIEVPDELHDTFSEMVPPFVVQEIPDRYIPEEMKIWKKNSEGYKRVTGCHEGKKNSFVRALD